MAKESTTAVPHADAISIIGPGMKILGDCDTEGTLRIEGSVRGTVRAGKAVVIGKDGVVEKLRAMGYEVERVCSSCGFGANPPSGGQ